MRSSVLLALTASLLVPAAAPAAPALRDVEPAVAPLAVDGDVLAYATGSGPRAVRRRGAGGRVLGDVATPGPCTFADAGAGALLWDCASQEPSGLVVEPATGRRTVLPAAPSNDLGQAGRWTGIGRHWLEALTVGYHFSATSFVSRADGSIRPEDDAETRRIPDLDLPGLWRTLCRPAERRMVSDGFLGLEPGRYASRPPYGAARSDIDTPDGIEAGPLYLDRCGAAPRVLSRCRRGCGDPRIGPGAVAWREGPARRSRVRVRLLASRRTLTVRVAGVEDVALTGRRLWVLAGGRLRTLVLPR